MSEGSLGILVIVFTCMVCTIGIKLNNFFFFFFFWPLKGLVEASGALRTVLVYEICFNAVFLMPYI